MHKYSVQFAVCWLNSHAISNRHFCCDIEVGLNLMALKNIFLHFQMQLTSDPRRADRERRFKPPPATSAPAEDLTTDYMNILGIFSTLFYCLCTEP